MGAQPIYFYAKYTIKQLHVCEQLPIANPIKQLYNLWQIENFTRHTTKRR